MDLRHAAQQRSQNRDKAGIGPSRRTGFKAQFKREQVERGGKTLVRLQGIASTVEQPYEMWDFFGPYEEVVARGAFDWTLAQNPDVAYLFNHCGMTMARTKNGTLNLSADQYMGLMTEAFLNPERSDIQQMLTAIDDGVVDEMSFAFVIEDGEWSDDMMTYRIHRVNLDRGDVSAVNFGANPNTVAARSGDILRELALLPRGAQQEASRRLGEALTARASIDDDTTGDGTDPDMETDDGDGVSDNNNDPVKLIQAVDAALDEALTQIEGVDTTTLPGNVAQALGLISAAGTAIDAYMDVQGIDDPDERAQAFDLATRELHSHMETCTETAATDTADETETRTEAGEPETRIDTSPEERGAEPVHHTKTVDTSWDAGEAVKAAGNDAKELAYMHAWVDSSKPADEKGSYKMPHHTAGTDTAANLHAVRNALARLDETDIPEGDKAKVKAHLDAHLKDGGGEPSEKSHTHPEQSGRSVRLLELMLEAA